MNENLSLPKYIAQGLLQRWKREKQAETGNTGVIPLTEYLEYNYNVRYVALCERLNVQPVSFAKWLMKPIESVI